MQRASVNSRLWSHRRKENITCCRWRAWYIYTTCLYNKWHHEFRNEKILSAMKQTFILCQLQQNKRMSEMKEMKDQFQSTLNTCFLISEQGSCSKKHLLTEQNTDIETINNLLSIGSLKT